MCHDRDFRFIKKRMDCAADGAGVAGTVRFPTGMATSMEKFAPNCLVTRGFRPGGAPVGMSVVRFGVTRPATTRGCPGHAFGEAWWRFPQGAVSEQGDGLL